MMCVVVISVPDNGDPEKREYRLWAMNEEAAWKKARAIYRAQNRYKGDVKVHSVEYA